MLRHFGTHRVPVDEAVVQIALTPMYVGELESEEDRQAFLHAILRTGTTFVLNPEDAPGWGASVEDVSWNPWDGLPPLPFPRLWIECGHPDQSGPIPFPVMDIDSDESWSATSHWSGMFGVGIVGNENGWVVAELHEVPDEFTFAMRYPWDDDTNVSVVVERLAPDASGHYPYPTDPEERERLYEQRGLYDPHNKAMTAWRAILLVQMIDVLGARQVPLQVPRPHRRAYERRYGAAHPSVYFVDLRQTGESKIGSGDRQYHHRWLVRGHWRHFADGRRTWVRPYVKGPVGAPWRGRPIYLDRSRSEDTTKTDI
jgi:hypothetical protein